MPNKFLLTITYAPLGANILLARRGVSFFVMAVRHGELLFQFL